MFFKLCKRAPLTEIGRFAEGSPFPFVDTTDCIDFTESTLEEEAFFFAVGTAKLGEPCRMLFACEEFNVQQFTFTGFVTNEQRTDVKVGITVFAAISLLLFGILWAKHVTFGPADQIVKAHFISAGGLETGSPVLVNGVRRGSVSTVELANDGVIVSMAMDKPVDLRRDASATITMLELMGGKKVEINPGLASGHLAANAVLPGLNSGDIGTIVATITALSGTLESITGKTDTLFASMNSLLSGDTLKRQLSVTLSTLTRTANQASSLIAQNGPAIKKTFEQSEIATRELAGSLQENRTGIKTLVDSGGAAVRDARQAMLRINQLSMRFDSLLSGATQEHTMFYALMKDKEFSGRIDSAFNSLFRLTEQMRKEGIDANIRFFSSTKGK
jgi:phospholipid/cholesterol/gamma-HCH transport system substrate-binding protein